MENMWLLPYTLAICISLVAGGPIHRNSSNLENYKTKDFSDNSNNAKYKEELSDLADRQSIWERSAEFEEDILLSDEQDLLSTAVRNTSNNTELWKDSRVFYTIQDKNFTLKNIAEIKLIIQFLEKVSCIRFQKRTDEDNYILIRSQEEGCFADLGMKGGQQIMNLESVGDADKDDCFPRSTLVHEFLHALGLPHIHTAHNRDDYVTILWDNIIPADKYNFDKKNETDPSDLKYPYDYRSILHYSEYMSSRNGKKTMVAKKEGQVIGPKDFPTPTDFKKLNELYKCKPEDYVIATTYE